MSFRHFLGFLTLFALLPPAAAAPPAWWATGNPPIITGTEANNRAPANIGQAKWMVNEALRTLDTAAPTLAFQIRADLAGTAPDFTNRILDLTVPNPKSPSWLAAQKSPLLLGQLKAISAPFYTRLDAAYPTWLTTERTTNATNLPNSIFPWTTTQDDDHNKATATLGQLKAVFSLRFETLPSLSPDTDNDGMPDAWEISQNLSPQVNDANQDPDLDGFSNIREYYMGSDPKDINDRPKGMVAAKGLHSVALTADGRVWSWGYNGSGELGDGTTEIRKAPVPLAVAAGMARILWIDTGNNSSFALDENGVLWAWGRNYNYQISKDATSQFSAPVRVELPALIARFACGIDHVLAVDRTGRLWSWGSNSHGQLGLGHTNTVSGVFEITKPSGMGVVMSVVASGTNSFAVDTAGKMWSWGYNGGGELGDGTYTSRNAPRAVDASTGVPAVKSIVAGDSHTMAAAVDGSIWTWGYNGSGQLGSGNTTRSNKPIKITTGLNLAKTLGVGSNHSLAVSPSGSVWTWGANYSGQLGINSTSSSSSPVQTSFVSGGSDLIQVAGGLEHSLALKKDGSIWSWGSNSYGQLGIGNTTQQLVSTQIPSLKLVDDDSDADGLPDSWERFYFGNLLQTGTGVYVANGVTNLVAYAVGLNPTMVDHDNDGISNAVELAANLDPLDWSDATGDLDGDRIPNLWESAMGSSMEDSGIRPAITATVGAGQSIQTAINTVVGNSTNPPWAIIQVQPGVYSENINIPYGKRILLIPASNSGIPEIRGSTGSATITFSGEGVLDGFRITHAKGATGNGVTAEMPSGRALARVVNCLIHDHSGSNRGGIYGSSGRLVIAHCSILRNSASGQGNGLHVRTSARTRVMNSIFWNPTGLATSEVYSSGVTESRQTIVRDGSIAGASTEDPLLNPLGLLTKASPARSKGTSRALGFRDIHGEARGTQPDIGADQFIDTDNDGLPDWLEALGVTSTTQDNDGDGISNLTEYEINGTNPIVADTDGDDLNDGGEAAAGSNPFDPDTDTDGIQDDWEVKYGLNPTNDQDSLKDLDGDRIPNLYEFIYKTIPSSPSSLPSTHITIDQSVTTDTLTVKRTIQAGISAIENKNRYTIIRVKPGRYPESLEVTDNSFTKRILFLGDLGANPPLISPTSGSALRIEASSVVFNGFSITWAGSRKASSYIGVYFNGNGTNDQMRLVNCTISGFRSDNGSAVNVGLGSLGLEHSTIIDNGAWTGGAVIFLQSAGRLNLSNSIVWNPAATVTEQIHRTTTDSAVATSCIILGGELGANPTAPKTDRYHGLLPGSPAIGAGSNKLFPSLDRHGELRPAIAPDIGADQHLDSDLDSLPDWWEKAYFGNILKSPTGDDDIPISDGISNFYEYILGFNPLLGSTNGGYEGDRYEAVFTRRGDTYYPSEWWLDPDGDGLTNNYEIYYQSSPSIPDTNGDGVSDLAAVFAGLSSTSNDTDGDGIANTVELANGTSPVMADTDGDGVNDGADALPLDPSVTVLIPLSPTDTTGPLISLQQPAGAVLQP